MAVPTDSELAALRAELERFGLWYYEIDLGHGMRTSAGTPWVMEASLVRKRMVWPILERTFGSRWPETDCIDVACGEGFYLSHLAPFGPRRIRAIDARQVNIDKARFVAKCLALENVDIGVGNAYDLSPDSFGTFDLCLCLGLLYHVEDPMYVLRRLRSVTRELCVIDTQVTQDTPVAFGWLTADKRKSTNQVFAINEEPDCVWNPAASLGPISLIPSEAALRTMLLHAGFRKIEPVPPVESSFDAFTTRDRVLFLAWV